jgi:inorganic pyrophosphatase
MTIKAIIEIPKGSKKKNEIKATGTNRVLYKVDKGFIANYGRIPHTLAGDGDSADIFVLGKRLKIGTELDTVAHALVEYTHRGKEDNKVIAYDGKLTHFKKRQFAKLIKFLTAQEGTGEQYGGRAAEKYVTDKTIKKV